MVEYSLYRLVVVFAGICFVMFLAMMYGIFRVCLLVIGFDFYYWWC